MKDYEYGGKMKQGIYGSALWRGNEIVISLVHAIGILHLIAELIHDLNIFLLL